MIYDIRFWIATTVILALLYVFDGQLCRLLIERRERRILGPSNERKPKNKTRRRNAKENAENLRRYAKERSKRPAWEEEEEKAQRVDYFGKPAGNDPNGWTNGKKYG